MAAGDLRWTVVRDTTSTWSRRLHTRVETETQTFCENVLAQAQGNVRVRTGETRDSGRVEKVGDDPLVYTVSFEGAALWLEFGTVNMPAYPFLRPAYAAALGDYLRRLAITTQGRIRSSGMSTGMDSERASSFGVEL